MLLKPLESYLRLVAVTHSIKSAADFGINCQQVIGTTTGAFGFVANIRRRAEEISIDGSVAVILLLLERPGSLGTVHLFKIGDAGVLLAGGPGFHEVGDRDSREQANDRNNDHDFNQREAGFARGAQFHTYYLSNDGVNLAQAVL